MSYTHYFMAPKGVEGYEQALPIVKDILKRYKSIVAFEDGDEGDAVANNEIIRFNGVDGEGYETFWFENWATKFSFCKTNRMPYDIVVCEVLAALRFHIPKLHVGSDGFPNSDKDLSEVWDRVDELDESWAEALDNVSRLYNLDFSKLKPNHVLEELM